MGSQSQAALEDFAARLLVSEHQYVAQRRLEHDARRGHHLHDIDIELYVVVFGQVVETTKTNRHK